MNCKICRKELTKKQTKYCSTDCKSKAHHLAPKVTADNTKQFKCKIDGKLFNFGAKSSGALKKYSINKLLKEYDENDWEIVEKTINIEDFWQCPHCEWKGKANDGKDGGGWIAKHLNDVHQISKVGHVNQFPHDSGLWPVRLAREQTKIKVNEHEDNRIECKECGEYFTTLTNSHLLKRHGMTKDEYRKKHDVAILSSDEYRKRLSIQYYNNDALQASNSWRSKYEDELCDLFQSLNIAYIPNHKKFGFDIDILLPDHNLAIEFNGLYFHSEYAGGKTEMYHLNKSKQCEERHIHLIHIFEDEWVKKREIVISRLKNLLGKTENVVYARKCELKEIDYKTVSVFLDQNHIQGTVTSLKFNLGLFYNNELVSVMGFGFPRASMGHKIQKEGEWELQRFCNKLNFTVVGGASKMFKYFEINKNPVIVTSHADRRWTSTIKDSLYDELGLTLVSKGTPNYWYLVEPMKRHYRFSFNKQNILKKFKLANPELSEWQNMIELGFDRIWDCGSLGYKKVYSNIRPEIDLSEPVEEIKPRPVKRRRKRKETNQNIVDVECKICSNSYSIRGIASHFKLNHGLTVEEYVSVHGEYRTVQLKQIELGEKSVGDFNCKICGFECRGEKHLSSHVLLTHQMKKIEYVETVIFNNQLPTCKCGCGNPASILSYAPYFREYLSGHNAKGQNNPMFGKEHSKEAKVKMSDTKATKR